METKHPARYTDSLIPIFAKLLLDCNEVLDVFAGTGKLALIKNYGFNGKVICNELEAEWANSSQYDVDEWNIGDAKNLSWINGIDAICTSPTYGNRMADSHNAKDNSRRITYTHYLGRKLSENNSGSMQWGEKYKKLHEEVWGQCFNTLKCNGLLIINISNHIRKGVEVDVVGWHIKTLLDIGFIFKEHIKVETPRMKFGKNHEKRVLNESILVFYKPAIEQALKEKNHART